MNIKHNIIQVDKISADIFVTDATKEEILDLYYETVYKFWHYFSYITCTPRSFRLDQPELDNIQINSYNYENDHGIYRLLAITEENNNLTARILVNTHDKEDYKYYAIIKTFTGDNKAIAYYTIHPEQFNVLINVNRTILENVFNKSKYIDSNIMNISYLKKNGCFCVNTGLIADLNYVVEATYRINSGVLKIHISSSKLKNSIEYQTKNLVDIDSKICKLLVINGLSDLILQTEAVYA